MVTIDDTNLEDEPDAPQDIYELVDEPSGLDDQAAGEDMITRGEKKINRVAKQIFRVLVLISGLLVIALSIPGILEKSIALFILAGDVIVLAILGIIESMENSKRE
ncbi:MAG: hypothetical protein HGA54_10350 [Actinobacteria bacterium]|nr:hypothetical protein [Actinomycetota bacterium]